MRIFNYAYQYLNDIQIHTVGCDICIYDAHQFANTLPADEKAIVFNTCSVFEDREIENQVLLKYLAHAFPEHTVHVLGCDINRMRETYSQYEHVYTNEDVRAIIEKEPIVDNIKTDEDILFLKIQDGCQHQCTFCIINQLRNAPYSVPYHTIVNRLRLQLENQNKSRVELAGTELTTYYDRETGYRISDVLEHLIQDIPEIERFTLTSIDPAHPEVENIIRTIAKYPDKFIPHLTLAVQSGNDDILKAMKRRHTVERVRYLHTLAAENNISIGWDIIVGFPGETHEQFMDTYNLMLELRPLTQTMFAFSGRRGTPAFDMPDQVPEKEKRRRLAKIYNLMHGYARDEKKESFDSYAEYTEENTKYIQANQNKRKALDLISTGTARMVDLDLFDIAQFSTILRTECDDVILNVKYDVARSLECDILINFLKEFKRGIPLIVNIPNELEIDTETFENHYHCIVQRIN